MTESEKAKAYDEALEKGRIFRDHLLETGDKGIAGEIEYIFPELAESENERIRKEIVRFIQMEVEDEIVGKKWLAWLEKQGSSSIKWQKNTPDNKPATNHSVLMKTTHGVAEGYFVGSLWFQFRWSSNIKDSDVLAWMELSDLNEQGEQKSSNVDYYQVDDEVGNLNDWVITTSHDKVETKFKVGDWIVQENIGVYKVIEVCESWYEVVDNKDKHYSIGFDKEYMCHLWTIQDANEGDVVVDKSDGTIGIFECIGHHPDGGSYNDPSYCFLHCRYDDGDFFADFEGGNMMDSDDVIPATKEQRDLLFQKMKEARYTFDFEKKELKKIEDEIEIPFGAKDSELQEVTYYIPKGFHAEIDDDKVVIKKGEKSAAWSDEDEEHLQDCIGAIWSANYYLYDKQEMEAWLKSLKDRIGG